MCVGGVVNSKAVAQRTGAGGARATATYSVVANSKDGVLPQSFFTAATCLVTMAVHGLALLGREKKKKKKLGKPTQPPEKTHLKVNLRHRAAGKLEQHRGRLGVRRPGVKVDWSMKKEGKCNRH